MNPCFGPAQIRDLMPTLFEKALKVSGFLLEATALILIHLV